MSPAVYVVTAPEGSRGIYDTWPACEAVVKGARGARFQKVASRDEAEALLSGVGVLLPPGVYAFTDGNDAGGIGIVFIKRSPDGRTVTREIRTTVQDVLAPLPFSLDAHHCSEALSSLRNVLAEMTACYHALTIVHAQTSLTLVYDYLGVGSWLQRTWLPPADPLVRQIVTACRDLIRTNTLTVSYVHQPGHRSCWAGRHEFAEFNAKADALATAAGQVRS